MMALARFKLNKLTDFQQKFRLKWKNEEKCSCINQLNENELPWCKHLIKELKKITKEQENSIWKATMTGYIFR